MMNKKIIGKLLAASLMLPVAVHAAPTLSPLTKLQHQLSVNKGATAFPVSPIYQSLLSLTQKALKPLTAEEKPYHVTEDVLVIDGSGVVTQMTTALDHPLTMQIPEDIALIDDSVTASLQAQLAEPTLKQVLPKSVVAEALPHPKKPVSAAPKSTWAIQVGSFKNKDNALRLTHTLRAKGYEAFTREKKNTGIICVLVRPQPKHTSAAMLAEEIENAVHINGFIVTSS